MLAKVMQTLSPETLALLFILSDSILVAHITVNSDSLSVRNIGIGLTDYYTAITVKCLFV